MRFRQRLLTLLMVVLVAGCRHNKPPVKGGAVVLPARPATAPVSRASRPATTQAVGAGLGTPAATAGTQPAASGPVMPADQISDWMMTFAKHPTPDQVGPALRGFAAAGLSKRSGGGPAATFFGLVMRQYPQRTAEWAAVLDTLPATDQTALWPAVQAADTDAGRAELARRAAGNGPAAALCRQLRAVPPPDLLHPASVTPETLDRWWAAYFATGQAEYVNAVIGVAAGPEGSTVDMTWAAARWSLAALRRQDPQVRSIVDDFVARQASPQQRKALADLTRDPATRAGR